MSNKLSGLVCVRNGHELDYCWREAAFSLIPHCDEVVICDGESTDGTAEAVADLVKTDSRFRAITYPWPSPHQNEFFWVEWLNWARLHLKYPMMLSLDADEVLADGCKDAIEAICEKGISAQFQRLNFWKDAHHLAPENKCCGTMVARIGPSHLYLPSDEPVPRVSPNIREGAGYFPAVHIFHYGFIREPRAFAKKSVAVQNMFFGSCDKRITDMDAAGRDWRERDYFDGAELRRYEGPHPRVAHDWLRARGYQIP